MLNIKRVIDEIMHVGLYDLVLQDVQKFVGKEKPTSSEVKEAIDKKPEILREYMQTTIEYNLSNIHLKDIDLETISDEKAKEKAKEINSNLNTLRDIEKYTLDFEQSPTLVLIFSVEFFVLFSVQYFIVLLDLKEWQWWIYTLFALSIAFAWWYAKKVQKKYIKNSKLYKKIYSKTLELIEELERDGYIKKDNLYIESCDDHI